MDLLPDVKINVRPSTRAKRFRLVSGINGVEAIVPPEYNAEELQRFVSARRDWIIKTSRYYSKLRDRCGEMEPDTIYFRGSKYKFNVVKDRHESVIVSDQLRTVTFHVTDKRRYKQEIEKWYKQETGRIIADRLPLLAGRFGLQYNKASIKSQSSRWASCSKKRNLNFNLLLAAAPPEVIDYVIIHELMHLLEMDHSKRFWQLVENADPDFKRHREWLSTYTPVITIG